MGNTILDLAEVKHHALRSDGHLFIEGEDQGEGDVDGIEYENGTLTLEELHAFDELLFLPREASEERINVWSHLDAPLFDPNKTIDADGQPILSGGRRVKINEEGVWGYVGDKKRAGFDTDGRWKAGGGAVQADEDGLHLHHDGVRTARFTPEGELRDVEDYPVIDINGNFTGKIIAQDRVNTEALSGDYTEDGIGVYDMSVGGNVRVPRGKVWVVEVKPLVGQFHIEFSDPVEIESFNQSIYGAFHTDGGVTATMGGRTYLEKVRFVCMMQIIGYDGNYYNYRDAYQAFYWNIREVPSIDQIGNTIPTV